VLIRLLLQLQESTAARLRILLTSRPESPILSGFKKIEGGYQHHVLQEIPDSEIKRDMSLFLNDRFSKIREERSLAPGWPGDDRIKTITTMADSSFIFAATVCRFILQRPFTPEVRLQKFLNNPAMTSASKMDQTYRPILESLLTGQEEDDSETLVQEFRDIVGVIVLLYAPLSVNALAKLLDRSKDDIVNLLDSFHSVLSVPSDQDLPVRIFHLSFRDYLLDDSHKKKEGIFRFWVDHSEKHPQIANQCLKIMRNSLKKNICNLPGDGTLRVDIDKKIIDQNLPPELKYSCRYWAQHLVQGRGHACEMDNVFSFLQEHFLHWLEAMSIMGIVSEVLGLTSSLQSVIPVR
jgi:hypothetical protein